jgi:putative DNA primase/helicase
LPDLAVGGDVSDWLAAGGTKEKLVELCAAAALYTAETLDPSDPMQTARALIAGAFADANGLRTLHRHRGAFWTYTGSHYQLADDEIIRSTIWTFLEKSWRLEKKKDSEEWTIVPFKPTSARVSGVLDALGAVIQLDKYIEPPAWLTQHTVPPAVELLACDNGLLHLPTGTIYPPTPDYFGLSASEVIFDPTAA